MHNNGQEKHKMQNAQKHTLSYHKQNVFINGVGSYFRAIYN